MSKLSEFEQAIQRMKQRGAEGKRIILAEELERQRINTLDEKQKLLGLEEERKRVQAPARREERRKALPLVQERALKFLQGINECLFEGNGQITNWKKGEDIHVHTQYRQETVPEDGWNRTENVDESWTHNSIQLVASLKLPYTGNPKDPTDKTLYFSIPVSGLSNNAISGGKNIWVPYRDDPDFEANRITLGGQKCDQDICRVDDSFFTKSDKEWRREILAEDKAALEADRFGYEKWVQNRMIERRTKIACNIPFKEEDWDRFKEKVIHYMGETFTLE